MPLQSVSLLKTTTSLQLKKQRSRSAEWLPKGTTITCAFVEQSTEGSISRLSNWSIQTFGADQRRAPQNTTNDKDRKKIQIIRKGEIGSILAENQTIMTIFLMFSLDEIFKLRLYMLSKGTRKVLLSLVPIYEKTLRDHLNFTSISRGLLPNFYTELN